MPQVLGYAGNVVDVLFMAVKAALSNTRIPKVELVDLGEGQFDFEIADEGESAMVPLSGNEHTPVCITLSKVTGKLV
jgi:exosome complex component RRP42